MIRRVMLIGFWLQWKYADPFLMRSPPVQRRLAPHVGDPDGAPELGAHSRPLLRPRGRGAVERKVGAAGPPPVPVGAPRDLFKLRRGRNVPHAVPCKVLARRGVPEAACRVCAAERKAVRSHSARSQSLIGTPATPPVHNVLDADLRDDRKLSNCSRVDVPGNVGQALVPHVAAGVAPAVPLQDGVHGGPPDLRAPEPQRRLVCRAL